MFLCVALVVMTTGVDVLSILDVYLHFASNILAFIYALTKLFRDAGSSCP